MKTDEVSMLSDMKSYCHLKPGENGTKRLLEQYGQSLLCVRYRYDRKRRVRVKTVELIVNLSSRKNPGILLSVSKTTIW